MEEFLRPAIVKRINYNQYKSIPKSSSVHFLTSILHTWLQYTDDNKASVSVILFDFNKSYVPGQ